VFSAFRPSFFFKGARLASAGRCLPAALLPVPAPRGRWRADVRAPVVAYEPIASTQERGWELRRAVL